MPIPGVLLYGGGSELLIALVAIIILGLTDWVDGIMARREGPSVLGGLLDPVADKIFIAVIYLPLTDRGVIPLAIAACILCRDFVLTSLRTSLSLRDAPMRTATLAKYKTAIQMAGIGYVILYLAHAEEPDATLVYVGISTPILLPLGLILYRLAKGLKQGPRSATMLSLMVLCVVMRVYLGPELAIQASIYIIAMLTVVSGFSYLVDAWSALKGQTGSVKEAMRFGLDGVLVPVSVVLLLGYYNSAFMSTAVILIITLELAVGGLGNLLASRKETFHLRWMTVKSAVQALLAVGALALFAIGDGERCLAGEALITSILALTVINCVGVFWRHRRVYLGAI